MYEQKILQNIKISQNGCWNWQKSTDTNGYGRFTMKRKSMSSHRASYEAFIGPIPKGIFVCHSCNNKRCCNPSHLYLGSHRENILHAIRDGLIKKPFLKGEGNVSATLIKNNILDIRRLSREGVSYSKLSKIFNVHKSQIERIVNRKLWKHV